MKKNWMEFGRSMVEMLGVLAVIGVLSIVGLAGYKKAMNKFHANELMNLAMQVYNEAVARSLVTPLNCDRFYSRHVTWSPCSDGVNNFGGDRPAGQMRCLSLWLR